MPQTDKEAVSTWGLIKFPIWPPYLKDRIKLPIEEEPKASLLPCFNYQLAN